MPVHNARAICKENGCGKKHFSMGLCKMHYSRMYKTGSTEYTSKTQQASSFILNLPLYGDECIIWPFARYNTGYGIYGKTTAHAVVCTEAHGPKPSPFHEAAHSCGKGHEGCVAPYHLGWKTRKENASDRAVHDTQRRGADIPGARLTEDNVRSIRREILTSTNKEIARKYGVATATISHIVSRKTWRHVE